jgi:hypothetical protein
MGVVRTVRPYLTLGSVSFAHGNPLLPRILSPGGFGQRESAARCLAKGEPTGAWAHSDTGSFLALDFDAGGCDNCRHRAPAAARLF